ncbi:unnamed protein product [Choristocarpus tenellus]
MVVMLPCTRLLFMAAVMLQMVGISAYECSSSTRPNTDNWGESIADLSSSTAFPIDDYGGVVAFDASHCLKICCELQECSVAVFNDIEALCYLKIENALEESHFHDADEHMTSWVINTRQGTPEPIVLEPTECKEKRGVAFSFDNIDDVEALSPALSWWYNWSPGITSVDISEVSVHGMEYIPMIWGRKDLNKQERLENLMRLVGSTPFLLGFNEPNFKAQANFTPEEAAMLWVDVKVEADALGAGLVSPAVNFCEEDCVEEDPYKWLEEFFSECSKISGGCGITYLAVHAYTCEVRYLNKHLHQYSKFGIPIWLTEFACGDNASVMTEEGQASYLQDALTYLEINPNIYKYAWFTGRGGNDVGVGGSDLLGAGVGELTAVGQIFTSLYADLQHCSRSSTSNTDGVELTGTVSIEVPPGKYNQLMPNVDPDADVTTEVMITNVGGSGYYDDITNMFDGTGMSCSNYDSSCVTEATCVSGALAPFDEEISLAFRGPLNIHNIAWYEGEATSLMLSSRWTPTFSDNLVFMKNLGAVEGCAGTWSICGGNSQSYCNAKGTMCASSPSQFNGKLPGDEEINIMSAVKCTGTEDCGFYRDVGLHGWSGGSDGTKVVVFELDMPHCGDAGFDSCTHDRPAVWALNAKLTQYGCNCRGVGGNGGCGEFDIVEAVIGNKYSDMLFTSAYDFKGTASPGQKVYFLRPHQIPVHFAAIFRGGQDAYLQVVELDTWDYDDTAPFQSGELLDIFAEHSSEKYPIYNVNSREVSTVRGLTLIC